MTDKKVVPIRGEAEDPTSGVMKVARPSSSSTEFVTPAEQRRRSMQALLDVAATGYQAAARARRDGDMVGAAMIVASCARAIEMIQELGEEIAGL